MRRLTALLLLTLSALFLTPAPAGAQDCPGGSAAEGAIAEIDAALASIDSAPSAIPAPSFRDEGFREAAVPADVQEATLAEVLSRVYEHTRARAEDPSKPKAVVVLDIDYTAMMHVTRTERALVRLAERYDIEELREPATLPILPTYEKEGFLRFVDSLDLRTKYPDVDFDDVHRDFSRASWTPDVARSETITPGLHEFLRRVKYTGGTVVYLTGRREREREDLLAVFAAAGIENPNLVLKDNSMRTPAFKASKVAEIEATYGEIVAVIDDMKDNRDAILAATGPDAMEVPIAVPGFTTDITPEALDASPFRLSTFERNRAVAER